MASADDSRSAVRRLTDSHLARESSPGVRGAARRPQGFTTNQRVRYAGGGFRLPPRGKTYQTTRATTMIAAAIATTATVEAAKTTL
jgi:hypothetical protein